MDWKTETGTYLLLLPYLSLLTFGTNDANVWEHGAAMNLSLSFREIPVTSSVFSSSFILFHSPNFYQHCMNSIILMLLVHNSSILLDNIH